MHLSRLWVWASVIILMGSPFHTIGTKNREDTMQVSRSSSRAEEQRARRPHVERFSSCKYAEVDILEALPLLCRKTAHNPLRDREPVRGISHIICNVTKPWERSTSILD